MCEVFESLVQLVLPEHPLKVYPRLQVCRYPFRVPLQPNLAGAVVGVGQLPRLAIAVCEIKIDALDDD